ncbi:MAG: transposase [Clostridium sp.]|nr:transposase [Clostridium sp.]
MYTRTKTKIVLEAIRGEREIKELASEYNLQPNLIRNWKREFLENSSMVFDTKRDEKAMEAANELQEENDELAKKVGRLSTEVDWIKNLKKLSVMTTRVNLARNIKDSKTSKIKVKRAAELL